MPQIFSNVSVRLATPGRRVNDHRENFFRVHPQISCAAMQRHHQFDFCSHFKQDTLTFCDYLLCIWSRARITGYHELLISCHMILLLFWHSTCVRMHACKCVHAHTYKHTWIHTIIIIIIDIVEHCYIRYNPLDFYTLIHIMIIIMDVLTMYVSWHDVTIRFNTLWYVCMYMICI